MHLPGCDGSAWIWGPHNTSDMIHRMIALFKNLYTNSLTHPVNV